jgi:hypothetical protein
MPQSKLRGRHLNQAIIVLTMTNIRLVMGSMDRPVLSHRDEINERLLRVVTPPAMGLKVNRIESRHRAADRPSKRWAGR